MKNKEDMKKAFMSGCGGSDKIGAEEDAAKVNDEGGVPPSENCENSINSESAADPAEAEKIEAAAALPNEEKEALNEGYPGSNEFTRRDLCEEPVESNRGKIMTFDDVPEETRNMIIAEYLKSLISAKSVPLVIDGVPSPAPKNSPKSIKEAGELANKFLDN